MQLWQGLHSITAPFAASSVAIGVFDGVHRGHQALIARAVADARSRDRRAVVFTFDRHPAELLVPERAPGYITTPEQRAERIEALGVDDLVVARFDARFRDLSPEGFIRFVLCGVLGARTITVGRDFRFGQAQAGDVGYLLDARSRYDYHLAVLEPVLIDGEAASSTRIRKLIRDGNVTSARDVLGSPFVLNGEVVLGQQLGRKLGYPTANLETAFSQVVPADGIYAVRVYIDGMMYLGACSIGMRPTVGGKHRTIEVYILDFAADLYGRTIDLEFVTRLRDELRFESLDELVAQMARDVAQVRRLLVAPDEAI